MVMKNDPILVGDKPSPIMGSLDSKKNRFKILSRKPIGGMTTDERQEFIILEGQFREIKEKQILRTQEEQKQYRLRKQQARNDYCKSGSTSNRFYRLMKECNQQGLFIGSINQDYDESHFRDKVAEFNLEKLFK